MRHKLCPLIRKRRAARRQPPTLTCIHLSDPVLDDKRFTTSTEHTLDYRGREVLYSYAEASAISFCSASGANYAGNMNVKGYVVRWKYGANEKGEALSEIEPIIRQEGAGRDQPATLARHELQL